MPAVVARSLGVETARLIGVNDRQQRCGAGPWCDTKGKKRPFVGVVPGSAFDQQVKMGRPVRQIMLKYRRSEHLPDAITPTPQWHGRPARAHPAAPAR